MAQTRDANRNVARASRIKGSPLKLRRYARMIQGMPLEQALNTLAVISSPNAKKVWKVLRSAMANAENNYEEDASRLVIQEIYVNEGPVQKRFQPRARGRAFPILKRSSHMFIKLAQAPEKPEVNARAKAKAKAKAPKKETT